jgi:hypothetical protein
MELDPSLIQAVVAFLGVLAAFMAAMYGAITRPLLKRMDNIRGDLAQFKTGMQAELRSIHTELKAQGERLTRIEERRPPPLIHH